MASDTRRLVLPSFSEHVRELASRRAAWQPRPRRVLAGVLEKYERLVGPACGGAVTHAGALEWPYE